MSLSRNRHLELPRYDKNNQHRGGPRPGAGRKPKGLRAGVTHAKRAELDPSKPLHITLRVVAAVATLRTANAYRAIRRALRVSAFNQLGLLADRYHVEILTTPTQTSHAISYVLNNWRKHGEHRRATGLNRGRIDPFSSGAQFYDWAEPRMRMLAPPPGYEHAAIAAPLTWMLNIGYARGGPVSVLAVPRAEAQSQFVGGSACSW